MATHNIFTTPTLQTTQTRSICPQPVTDHAFSCRSLKLRQRLQWQKLAMKCGGNGGDRQEVKLQKDEMGREDDEMDDCKKEDVNEEVELMEMEALMGKDDGDGDEMEECKKEDVNEEVELMEMEALMGKDDGREPMDYKRRACIFYKSSELFQANKKQHRLHHCT